MGDLSFGGGLYVDAVRFNAIFAEVLFARHDADADGVLSVGEAQAALQFLVKRRRGRRGRVPARRGGRAERVVRRALREHECYLK